MLCYLGPLIVSDIFWGLASNAQILAKEDPKITSFDEDK